MKVSISGNHSSKEMGVTFTTDQGQIVHWARSLGMLLTLLAGLAAILTGVWVTHSPDPLWAIILLLWGLDRVRQAQARKFAWRPFVVGVALSVGYICLGGVVYFLKTPEVLWAMILVNWSADRLV